MSTQAQGFTVKAWLSREDKPGKQGLALRTTGYTYLHIKAGLAGRFTFTVARTFAARITVEHLRNGTYNLAVYDRRGDFMANYWVHEIAWTN